jgi:hypothetical protein
MNMLIIALIVIDALLLGALFFMTKRLIQQKVVQLESVFEERQIISRLREDIADSLDQTIKDNQTLLKKVQSMAGEAEMEILSGKAKLQEELSAILSGMSDRLEQPLAEFQARHAAIEKATKSAQRERELLGKALQRAEQLIKFLNQDLPYEEIIREIQDKKYSDARFLMTKGLNQDQIQQELGLSASEMRMILGASSRT